MAILIRGATILSLDAERGAEPFTGDILIEDDRISAVGSGPRERRRNGARRPEPAGDAGDHERPLPLVGELLQGPLRQPAARALDALLVPDPRPDPDLRPADLPAHDARGDRLPQARRHERARRRARDAGQSLDQLGVVFQAYEDVGIRASCSGHIINRMFTDTIPYVSEIMPQEILDEIKQVPVPSTGRLRRLREAGDRALPRPRRSAALRDRAERAAALHARTCSWLPRSSRGSTARPYHIHICETKMQAVTGREFYGKSLFRYMHDLGALHRARRRSPIPSGPPTRTSSSWRRAAAASRTTRSRT